MTLAHEWYGGVWPPTDLFVAVRRADGKDGSWSDAPGYQVGEKGSPSIVTLKAGETTILDIRVNWRGTGSIPAEPLIDESKPAKYWIKFLLFFKAASSEQFVESDATEIEVR